MRAGASSGQPRSAGRPAGARRHRFLILALLGGALVGGVLQAASHLGIVSMPRPAFGWSALAMSLVLAPVLEEVVFRGGIQEWLDRTASGRRDLLGGVSASNLLASLLFAAAHVFVAPTWVSVGTFVPSLVFGRLKQLYAPSLLPAMVVHAWYNLCFLAAAHAWLP